MGVWLVASPGGVTRLEERLHVCMSSVGTTVAYLVNSNDVRGRVDM